MRAAMHATTTPKTMAADHVKLAASITLLPVADTVGTARGADTETSGSAKSKTSGVVVFKPDDAARKKAKFVCRMGKGGGSEKMESGK